MATTSTTRARNGNHARAHDHAEAARRKVQARREELTGASAWVAERAGEWTLDGPDWEFMERQKFVWGPLVDYWFRMEVEGWERIPPSPVLLVGIHSGAPFVWDAWTILFQWWRHFGRSRQLHGTAHDALMAAPGVGAYFRRMGVIPAALDSMTAALAEGHDVALWPGGEIDSLRPWVDRDRAVLAGRAGFVKVATRSGVPIVPVATVGGPDAMPVLGTGRRLARWTGLDRMARIKRLPLALQAPWGIAPALLPEIPLPAKIRMSFEDAVQVDSDPAAADDDAYVREMYEQVQSRIQGGMDRLARRRSLPLFG